MSVIQDHREAGRNVERRRSRRVVATLLATGLVGIAFAVQAGAAGASNSTPASAVIPFTGDIYTLGANGNLIPVDISSTPPSALLFSLDGATLNQSWGQWSSATATSLVKTITRPGATYTDFKITLSGLIPGGVYSLFYRTISPDSANPVCGAVGDHEPLVALTARFPHRQAPDPDSFVAARSGGASFHARVAGRLLDAQLVLIDVIYHFDGNVHGPVPTAGEANNNCRSSFGIDTMRQLLIIQK
jgi:hypothetical protein